MGWLNAKLIITSIRFVDSSIWTLIDEMNIQAYINAFVGVKIISRETKFIALPDTKGLFKKKLLFALFASGRAIQNDMKMTFSTKFLIFSWKNV